VIISKIRNTIFHINNNQYVYLILNKITEINIDRGNYERAEVKVKIDITRAVMTLVLWNTDSIIKIKLLWKKKKIFI